MFPQIRYHDASGMRIVKAARIQGAATFELVEPSVHRDENFLDDVVHGAFDYAEPARGAPH